MQKTKQETKSIKKTKFVFFTGGVVSALGKGIAVSSLGALLKARGFRVTVIKFDPYINVDPGTMNPYQHGEVYVTDDGSETDLDLGHYERYLDCSMAKVNNATAGQIYKAVIDREREGGYLGATVQVIPHITDEIIRRIRDVALSGKGWDVVMCEIGGTVGDIEGLPFLEAIRQFGLEVGLNNCAYVHLTLVPYLKAAGEIKTKPTQHSVSTLREIGIQPDFLLCRTEHDLSDDVKRKMALFCSVPPDHVITAMDAKTIYEVPLMYEEQGFTNLLVKRLRLKAGAMEFDGWKQNLDRLKNAPGEVEIAICGKYTELHDAYKSIVEAFAHAGIPNDAKVKLTWVSSEDITDDTVNGFLSRMDGLLIPGGFGDRGIEGKICAVKFAREHKVPFFGICLGMQCAVIEFARNVLGWAGANSSEFKPRTQYPVIDLLPEQKKVTGKGANMRLGSIPCHIQRGSKAYDIYGQEVINERHRHRYEFNNQYREIFEERGMTFGGRSPDNKLVEMIELKDHPWFIGCQFHPELKSRFIHPHPLFKAFVGAALKFHKERKND